MSTATGTELAIRRQASAIPAKLQYAHELANSGLLPASYRKSPANILWAVEYGEMLGLSTMAAITGVHVIEGKPTASAGLISALVRRAGHKLHVRGNSKSATCVITRSDDPGNPFEVTWTLRKNGDDNPSAEEAKLLSKDVWQKYPASMLKSRAITQCARDACEEALFGLHYTAEELGAEVDEDGVVAGPAAGGTPQQLAGRSGGTPQDDPWYVRPAPEDQPADDRPWLDQALEQAAGLKSERAADKLWREAMGKVNDGAVSREDYERVRELISASVEDLRQKAFKQAMSVLAENEPWRDKIDELASGDDADAALAELEPMPDRKRQQRIAHAITTKAILARWNLADPAREVA